MFRLVLFLLFLQDAQAFEPLSIITALAGPLLSTFGIGGKEEAKAPQAKDCSEQSTLFFDSINISGDKCKSQASSFLCIICLMIVLMIFGTIAFLMYKRITKKKRRFLFF